MDQELIDLVHFFFSGTIRGHDIDCIPQRPQINACIQRIPRKAGGNRIEIPVLARSDLKGDDGAKDPDIPDHRDVFYPF